MNKFHFAGAEILLRHFLCRLTVHKSGEVRLPLTFSSSFVALSTPSEFVGLPQLTSFSL